MSVDEVHNSSIHYCRSSTTPQNRNPPHNTCVPVLSSAGSLNTQETSGKTRKGHNSETCFSFFIPKYIYLKYNGKLFWRILPTVPMLQPHFKCSQLLRKERAGLQGQEMSKPGVKNAECRLPRQQTWKPSSRRLTGLDMQIKLLKVRTARDPSPPHHDD